MKIVHITTHDFGGAGQAVLKYHESIISSGGKSRVICKYGKKNRDHVLSYYDVSKGFSIFEKLRQKITNRYRNFFVKSQYLCFDLFTKKRKKIIDWVESNIDIDTDVIIIYWIADYLTLNDIRKFQDKTGAKVYINVVDMSLLTGGCHFSYGCENYTFGCFSCPAATTSYGQTVIREKFDSDSEAIRSMNVNALCPISFGLNQANRSAKPFKQYDLVKPYISDKIFSYSDSYRNLPSKTILAGPYNKNDQRKGYSTFCSAMYRLNEKIRLDNNYVNILIPEGADVPELSFSNITIIYYPFADTDEQLSQIYNMADIFVNTSIDDTGPAMIIEALFCGVPVVATNTGVSEELLSGRDFYGTLVNIGDDKAISDAIYASLFSSNALIPSKEREYSVKSYYSKYKSIYDYLCDEVS